MAPPPGAYLTTLLRSLHATTPIQDTPRLLSSSAYLLTLLSNPLNISLLTSQLLLAPAVWSDSTDLRFCLRVINLFRSAAVEVIAHNEQLATKDKEDGSIFAAKNMPKQDHEADHTRLSIEEWAEAVIKGASGMGTAPAWKQALVLTGLLIGLQGNGKSSLSRRTRRQLVAELVGRLNTAAQETTGHDDIGAQAIGLMLNYTWALLEEEEKIGLNWDCLLRNLVGTAFFSAEGYRGGYFLANVDEDVRQISGSQFGWSGQSNSFLQISALASQPLISSMGIFSRIIAYAVDHVRDSTIIQPLVDDLNVFSTTLLNHWRRTKLSEVDRSDERAYFDETTMNKTLPVIWRLLQSGLFAQVIILTSAIGRTLNDRHLAADHVAPHLAGQTLNILRSLYFITTHFGSTDAFSQHTFVHLTAIDILSYHPPHASTFLTSIAPPRSSIPSIANRPTHPLDRTLTLYFLNTAEHLTTILPSSFSSTVLLPAALPYLSPPTTFPNTTNTTDLDLLEASHSLFLSILSSPPNVHIALSHLPNYITILFDVFPSALSARQFTLAFKTLLRIITTPAVAAAVAVSHQASEEEAWDAMAETLIEMLVHRIAATPIGLPLPPRPTPVPPPTNSYTAFPPQPEDQGPNDIHTSLLLTLISSLPLLPVPLLQRHLPITADLIAAIPAYKAAENQRLCREALWGVLSSGEMDVERSEFAVGWWGTRGGKDVVLGESGGGDGAAKYEMSGAINSKL